MSETCTKEIRSDWHTHICGKPAKGEHEDQPLCGVHLRVVTKRAERNAKWEIDKATSDDFSAAVKAWAVDHEVEGIYVYDSKRSLVTLPFESLKELVNDD